MAYALHPQMYHRAILAIPQTAPNQVQAMQLHKQPLERLVGAFLGICDNLSFCLHAHNLQFEIKVLCNCIAAIACSA